MKKLILISIILQSSFALSSVVEEEVYLPTSSKHTINLILSHPDLTIDHMNSDGFELFGPKGMKKWLVDAGITFLDRAHVHTKDSLGAKYPSFEKVEANLKRIVALNPKIAKLFSIGKSNQGRDLWVVKLSDNVDVDEVEPEFKYISSMHGNEITGRPLTQMFLEDLINAYGSDSRITKLINNTEIYIMPSMNPDGSTRQQRGNAKNVDLNRNFPDWTRGDSNTSARRQPETMAVMKFQSQRKFSLSANYHGGAVVVNYPWDSTYDRHPLDGLAQELSLLYANENPVMRNSRRFSGGVTNGADWYVLHGGMQDWSYHWYNDLQLTIEVSGTKWPNYSSIPSYYRDNKESMLLYTEAVHQGAGFKVKSNMVDGSVRITQHLSGGKTKSLGSFGYAKGEFYKVLEKGEYTFDIKAENRDSMETISVTVDGSVSENNGNYSTL